MADKKISQLPTDTSPTLTDSVPTLDNETTTTKKTTLQKILDLFFTIANMPTAFRQGWFETAETHTYASWDATNKTGVVTIPTDGTTKYQAGQRYKITQVTGGTKYFIVTKVAATALTIYGGTDYTLNNETISSPYYSIQKAPFGFPLSPAKWTVTLSSAADRTPSVSTSYTSLTDSITAPIGIWWLKFKASLSLDVTSTASRSLSVTLSSDASTETNPQTTIVQRADDETAASASYGGTHSSETLIDVAAATTYLAMGKVNATANVNNYAMLGSTETPTLMRAVCAYL